VVLRLLFAGGDVEWQEVKQEIKGCIARSRIARQHANHDHDIKLAGTTLHTKTHKRTNKHMYQM
jgi:hypothetical protein